MTIAKERKQNLKETVNTIKYIVELYKHAVIFLSAWQKSIEKHEVQPTAFALLEFLSENCNNISLSLQQLGRISLIFH